MEHIVLLGDSILDNAHYVRDGQPDVAAQLRDAIARAGKAATWRVTHLARDGAVMADVTDVQQTLVPPSATVLVLSAGGNDGLGAFARMRAAPVRAAVDFLSGFGAAYGAMVDALRAAHPFVPLVLCTIYQPQMDALGWLADTVASVGVRLVNRAIRAAAEARRLPVLDLWDIFSRREDYANAIEPGVPGGHKLVRNLMALLARGDHQPCRYVLHADARYDAAFEATLPAVVHFAERRVAPQ